METAWNQQRQFVSDASHELRPPMAVILAQCDEAMDAELSPEEYRQGIEQVTAAQVTEAARSVTAHSSYFLKGETQ